MMSNEDKIFRKQLVESLNNIGKQLKRLADLEEKRWNEDHHIDIFEEDPDDSRGDKTY